MPKALHIHPEDNIAVCTSAVAANDEVTILEPDGSRYVLTSLSDIPFCNKIALTDIPAGAEIIKYGESIGKATEDIKKGAVADHNNIESQPRSYEDEYILKGAKHE